MSTSAVLTLSLSQKLAVANPAAVSKRSSGVTSIMNGSVGVLSRCLLSGASRPVHTTAKVSVLMRPTEYELVYACGCNNVIQEAQLSAEKVRI